jgi:beta-phosphoglucomutase family hydrolase
VRACLFDLDGVLTRTAKVHARAWQQMFDRFMADWSERTGRPLAPFTSGDYDRLIDGRPGLDGARAFLVSRGIDLPEGTPDDPAWTDTVHGLSNAKNELFLRLLAEGGVEVYEGSVAYVRAVRRAGLRTAVVSSSANTKQVLKASIADLFDVRIDGLVALERGLAGKPAPDTFLAAAHDLGVTPPAAAVFEDALAGVEAGRAGGFALVVGVDRVGQAEALLAHGADIVVDDLAELLDADEGKGRETGQTGQTAQTGESGVKEEAS